MSKLRTNLARWPGGSAGPYQNPRLMLLLRNVQITNQFGTVNLVVWVDLCHSSQITRKIRRPISESAADVAAQTRSRGRSAGPYQNPRLMLLLRNVQITNQFGTVNLVVWVDLCHSSQIARKIRRPISESAADVAAQRGSAGPYENPRLMLLLRNVQITNQFGTVNLVVWVDLCHSSQIARKIHRPISESAADVAAQTRSRGRSAGPYQNPRLMLLLRNVQITNQFGTVNLVVWPDLCQMCPNHSDGQEDPPAHIRIRGGCCCSDQIARKIRRPISESAADVAAQTRSQGRSAGPYQNPRLMLLLRNVQLTNQFGTNVQITNQFGTVNLVVWVDLCHSSQIARKIRRPISESAADVAAQTRSRGRSAGPYQNPRLMLLLRLSGLTCAKCAPTIQMARRIRRPISESAADVAAQKWPNYEPIWHSQIARKIRRPISESAADVAAQKCPNYEPIWHGGSAGPYQNPRLMLLLRLSGLTCAKRAPTIQMARRIAGPYQNPRLMLLLRLSGLTCAKCAPTSQMARKIRRPISESAADVAAQKCPNYEPIWHRWPGGSAGPYQNPRLMLLLRNGQITNQFGTMARKIRRPISESAADVAAQKCPNYESIWHVRWLGGSADPYQNPRLMLLLRLSSPTGVEAATWLGRSAGPYQNPRLMLLLRNGQITNPFGTVNLVVWPDLCQRAPTSQMARRICRPISESAADVAAQIRWLGGSAGPYQNPRLMLLLRNGQITNQFGTVNLVVWADLCHSSQIARKIRQPISESAADVAPQIVWAGLGQTSPNQSDGWEDSPAHIRICS
ncbi:hypothetical protein GGX14DRAFT_406084 [Mycena pura]|uniref:Uncharacterized protein n=1 Tax=Mycena pura TaxID=153505 RepID=A0AAD6Y3J5_9AGAR|nr:hypothetical protein GGX14DRAFT_406084 [Mycena pura]